MRTVIGAIRMLGLVILVTGLKVANASAQCSPVSPANYVNITNTGPEPCNYRPYTANSPWNNQLPEHPVSVITGGYTTEIQGYAANTSTVGWRTEANTYFSGCTGPNCGRSLGGGFPPVWKATTADVAVTFLCRPGSWCTVDDVTNTTTTRDIAGYIPANARTNCNVQDVCGDVNMSIVQPDGTIVGLYGCIVTSNFVTGDTIGPTGTKCGGNVAYTNLSTMKGLTGAVTTGPMLDAEMVRYGEVVTASLIPHALVFRVSCTQASTFVYPANNATFGCTTGGVPAGQRFFLDQSLAQIDALISAGTLIASMKPFYYAMHTYGAYVIDTGGCAGTKNFTCNLDGSPYLESAGPWIINGQTNSWIPWFQTTNGASIITNGNGNPQWYFTNNFWAPLATYLKALSPCYAQGTCADSGSGAPLTLACPSLVSATSANGNAVAVTYPSATPSGGIVPYSSVTGVPASGSLFPIGSTLVTQSVTDAVSSTATCTFTVAVGLLAPSTFPATATIVSKTVSTTSIILLAANPNRRQFFVGNNSGKIVYIAFAATATTLAYTLQIATGTAFESTLNGYTGAISAIVATGSGNVAVTEITP